MRPCLLIILFANIFALSEATCDNCKTCNFTTCLECNAGYYRSSGGCRLCEHVCSEDATSNLPKCREADGSCEFGCKTGFYGDKCSSPCSVTCKESLCERTTGKCLNGCTDTRFTGAFCLEYCGTGCFDGRCTQSGDCLNQCKPNYYNNPQCDRQCSACSSDSGTSSGRNCDITDGRCLHGCAGGTSWGPYCNKSCPTKCDRGGCDFNSGLCTGSCSNAIFWGEDCGNNCSENCLNGTCSKNDGHCLGGCATNTIWGPNCSRNCPNTCSESACNNTTGECLANCVNSATWGRNCTQNCPRYCNKNRCAKSDGKCVNGCGENSYWGERCTELCPEKCQNGVCSQVNANRTDGCANLLTWGPKCEISCPANCEKGQCNQLDGNCTNGCTNSTFWGSKCTNGCPANCASGECNQADGICSGGCINDASWGDTCTKDCPISCKGGECDKSNGQCTAGCKDDTTWGDNCTKSCPANCGGGQCSQSDGSCSQGCLNGTTWGPKCDTPCPSNCEEVQCSNVDGNCTQGCINSTSWGRTCANNCPTKCADGTCNQVNGTCTRGCKNGASWGDTCTEACPTNCKEGSCDKINGQCTAGCKNSANWGENCTRSCPANCESGTCSQTEGSCSEGCLNGATWGTDCETSCSSRCNERKCHQAGGICTDGCVNSTTWGTTCSDDCSTNCHNGKCNQTSGHCIEGCATNKIWGPSCNETCHTCENGCDPSSGVCSGKIEDISTNNLWLYIGLGCGLVVITAALIAVVVATKRKRSNRKTFEDEEGIVVERRSDGVNRSERAVRALTTLFVQNPFVKMIQKRITQTFRYRLTDSPKTNKIEVDKLLRTVLAMERSETEQEFEHLGDDFIKPYEAATRNENASKNTYTNVYPYDENRVILLHEDNKGTDYINASYINGFGMETRYIAAQGPSRQTREDFWKMIWQEHTTYIVMLNGTAENDGQMADKYLPEPGGAETFGDITVYSLSRENYADFVINMYKVAKAEKERKLVHMQFTDWNGGAPPSSPSSLIEFHQKCRSLFRLDENPIIVHCTGGVGRTGVFIALDFLMDEGLAEGAVDVYSCVSELRKQRAHMVQTQEQYEFLYKLVAQTLGLHCQLIPLADFANSSIDLEDQFQKCTESLEFDGEEIPTMSYDQEMSRKDNPSSDIPDPRYRPTITGKSYINAVFHDTYRQKRGIIVTQMPTADTIVDFCNLVTEKNCSTIVMLNQSEQNKQSSGLYWPKKGSTMKYGGVQVSTIKTEDNTTHTERMLKFEKKVKKVKESQAVKMIQFKDWEDVHMTPDPSQMIELVKTVREHMNRYPGRPLLVHCLNGSKQSGLYCVIHDLMEKLLTENEISVINSVRKLKVRIPQAVPSLEQFIVCYEAVNTLIENSAKSD